MIDVAQSVLDRLDEIEATNKVCVSVSVSVPAGAGAGATTTAPLLLLNLMIDT